MTTKVLLIEDNTMDAVLIKENIRMEGGGEYEITVAGTLKGGIGAGEKFDVVLLDMWLPDSDGIETLVKFREARAKVPVIIITGLDNSEMSIKTLQAGAQDYIVKDNLDGRVLIRAMRYAIERRAITDSLESSRVDLQHVIDGAPIMMFVAGPDMLVMKCNRAVTGFTGVKEADALGKRPGEILKCENCVNMNGRCMETPLCKKCPLYLYFNEAFLTGESFYRIEVKKNLLLNGVSTECYFYLSVVHLEYNSEDALLLSLEDITLNMKYSERQRETLNKMRDLDAMKANFISMISHELRTPVTSINGFLTLMMSGVGGSLSKQQLEFLEILKSNSDRLLNLINDILDMSKIESGTFPVDRHTSHVDSLLDKIIRETTGLVSKNNINLEKEGILKAVTADLDEFRIIQVMTNLIGNAVKFSPAGSSIIIGAREAGFDDIPKKAAASPGLDIRSKYLLMYVKDSGSGIEEAHIEKIFDRFYQASHSDNRVLKGVGLGLNISKNIIEAHHGTIWAESAGKDKGSVFKFVIPL
jgi:signal transduction histidine kinase/CheY-like chemotaxis protein